MSKALYYIDNRQAKQNQKTEKGIIQTLYFIKMKFIKS